MAREMCPSNGRTSMIPGVLNNVFRTFFSPLSSILKMSFFVFFRATGVIGGSDDMHLKDRRFFCSLSLLCPISNPMVYTIPFSDISISMSLFLNHTLCSKKRSLSFLGSSLDVSRQMFDLHHTVSHKCRAGGSAKSDLSIIRVEHVDPLMEILEARHFILFYSCDAAGDCRILYFVFAQVAVKP
ncbi:hypothetical protein AUEXF2481DRAFT_267298 [Aureobasidium subglaciale EXF-2481]|uniref:Uncharacterized protein n=1 Tax=Aureobasidium subglaciale (strain EXF-2481) TaxID=1043005 RepID=A0A074Y976_AURSE|nr:uncharacterized protein AUEXF2481DRAFT_267298 [Aureobasidium subglaciale EXF-2481]KEQ94305.1 hypothetical protein AUEXF2481DRAFT_267298 [Aureobasidium subglaciale EXF-2481]